MSKSVKVAILGSTGMLGGMVARFLSQQPEYDLCVIDHRGGEFPFDAAQVSVESLVYLLNGQDYIINCIGIIKPRIDEQNSCSVQRAVRVNALFPHMLAEVAERVGARVLQIATDCVYSGQGASAGSYFESSPHDPLDVYGKTKSLGEVRSPTVRHLRCSIVGPEQVDPPRPVCSLLQWFLAQPPSATVSGFTNHFWNGVTTLAFARLCHGIMSDERNFPVLPPVQHVLPAYAIPKSELLRNFAHFYSRRDIRIEEKEAASRVDRTLATDHPEVNEGLWQAAGYPAPPTIREMVAEMAGEVSR